MGSQLNPRQRSFFKTSGGARSGARYRGWQIIPTCSLTFVEAVERSRLVLFFLFLFGFCRSRGWGPFIRFNWIGKKDRGRHLMLTSQLAIKTEGAVVQHPSHYVIIVGIDASKPCGLRSVNKSAAKCKCAMRTLIFVSEVIEFAQPQKYGLMTQRLLDQKNLAAFSPSDLRCEPNHMTNQRENHQSASRNLSRVLGCGPSRFVGEMCRLDSEAQ